MKCTQGYWQKDEFSSKLCFNLLKFYTSEPAVRHFVQLTSRSTDHLEKLTRDQLEKKILIFYSEKGTFVSAFRHETHAGENKSSPVHSTTSNPVCLRSILNFKNRASYI